jgi:hypothetical protein
MAAAIANTRSAYHQLVDRVETALRTQIGDEARLRATRGDVLNFMAAANQVGCYLMMLCAEPDAILQLIDHFPRDEFEVLKSSVDRMVEALDCARDQSSDPPQGPALRVVSVLRTGKRGRPRVEIDRSFLEGALRLRGPHEIAPVLRADGRPICSGRTVRRRALEYGLSSPGAPVLIRTEDADGTVTQVHHSSTSAVSVLSDDELDGLVSSALERFPLIGRRMLQGSLDSAGHHVPRRRILESYVRVHGPSTSVFSRRSIHRRAYHVAGANSLWHHDGQHGKRVQSCIQTSP